MIDIAVVDDERSDGEKLKTYIDRFFSERGAGEGDYNVDVFTDGVSFLSAPSGIKDIVFMDIDMPVKDGFETAREYRKRNPGVCLIFVTNLAEMAIRGYEVDAMDFVVKPLEYPDFKYRMTKAVRRVMGTDRDYIVVKRDREMTRVYVQSIKYVEKRNHSLIYHTIGGDVETAGTMRETEDSLGGGYGFSLCNSGYLVNLRYVDGIRDGFCRVAGDELPISRGRKAAFTQAYSDFAAGRRNVR